MRTPFRKNHGKITFVLYNKPSFCGGSCLFCFKVKGLTKSTTLNDDTSLAQTTNWCGVEQLSERFNRYALKRGQAHKCDLAVKGDSFANHDPDYLRAFFKGVYDFLNGSESSTFEEAKVLQQNGADRCVTLKVETRPDHIDDEICKLMVELGITTVELGVQSLSNSVLEFNKRGHNVESVKHATHLLRKYGFEVVYQVMVGLPGSNPATDYQMLSEKLWLNEYSPDALKIYPCLLLSKDYVFQEKLRYLYRNKAWTPISSELYVNLLRQIGPFLPRYVHINRIQRVIAPEKIEAGISGEINRLLIPESQCLWYRSVAQQNNDLEANFQDYTICTHVQGNDRFCFEATINRNTLLGYGRMDLKRENSLALIRDIRVLGNMLPVASRNVLQRGCQHIGIGTAMMRKMEELAFKKGMLACIVKPSFGTVSWFKKNGYRKISEYYWGKPLTESVTNKIELPEYLQFNSTNH